MRGSEKKKKMSRAEVAEDAEKINKWKKQKHRHIGAVDDTELNRGIRD